MYPADLDLNFFEIFLIFENIFIYICNNPQKPLTNNLYT